MTHPSQEVSTLVVAARQAAREALSDFRQQDDYLLANGASLMSEDSHEILHIDTLDRIVNAALSSLSAALADKGAGEPDHQKLTEEARLVAAGFDMDDDLDRPDIECDCEKCAAYYRTSPPGAPAPGWQPIASAPKDGTAVFVYVKGDSLYPTAAQFKSRAYWEKEYGDPEYMAEGWYWSFGYPDDFHEEVIEPSHWMPLPASPTVPAPKENAA
jgi:hypothetical protein